MKFFCDSCGQRYSIADEKVRGRVLKIRCRRCNGVVVVREGSASEPDEEDDVNQTRLIPKGALDGILKAARGAAAATDDDERTRMMSFAEIEEARRGAQDDAAEEDDGPSAGAHADAAAEWHAVIGGKQLGPLTLEELEREVRSGRASARTYVWCDGMDGWKPIAEVDALRGLAGGGRRETPAEPPGPPVLGPRGDAPAEEAPRVVRPLDARPEPAGPDDGAYLEDEAAFGAEDDLDDEAIFAAADDLDDEGPLAEDTADGLGPEAADPARTDEDAPGAGIQSAAPQRREPHAQAAQRDASTTDDRLEALFGSARVDEEDDDAFSEALATDPFSLVENAPGFEAPRETTQMVILASGVNKRRSPVRIAAFVSGFLVVVLGMGYLALYAGGIDLGGVLPMPGRTRRAAAGSGPTDSAEARRMRDRLLGLGRKSGAGGAAASGGPIRNVAAVGGVPADGAAGPDEALPQKEAPKVESLSNTQKAALASLYGEKGRGAFSIEIKDAGGHAVDSTRSPIAPEVVARRIGEAQRAFQGCVQEEIRRNPSFKGGRVMLTLSVAPSGIVRAATLDDRALDLSDVGGCIKKAGRRIILPSFAGTEPVDFQVPLVLSTAY